MKIGTVIVYHPKLSLYLNAVKKCYEAWGRIVCVEADFKEVSEESARNQGLEQLGDCNFVWTPDADEFILKSDQERLINSITRSDADALMVNVIDYMSMNTVMDPPRSGTPIVLVKLNNLIDQPSNFRFNDGRCAPGNKPIVPVRMHHFGLCYPPEIQEWKAKNYWNTSDLEEYARLLKSKSKPAEIPDEIKALLSENMQNGDNNVDSGSTNNSSIKKKKRKYSRVGSVDKG